MGRKKYKLITGRLFTKDQYHSPSEVRLGIDLGVMFYNQGRSATIKSILLESGLGLDLLISEGGWFDRVLNGGIAGSFEIIRRGLKTWRLDVEGTIPENLKQRGVLDENVLSFYPYRDDALLLHCAIQNYVSKMVRHYYDTPDKLENDWELQSWVMELVKSKDEGGAGMLGVPGNGHFDNLDQLILVVTSVISTCSISHAAANFPQYETYGFPPNYPMLLKGKPPTDKTPRTEQDLIAIIPDQATTLDTMLIATILSQFATKSIGDFEVNYIFDPPAVEIVEAFKAHLAEISKIVKQRNERRPVPYKWLDPEIVPNAISI